MRPTRALTVSPSMLCAGVGVSAPGGGGVPGPGGCLLPGVYLVPGGGVPGQVLSPCGQIHACKHITLPPTSFAGGKYITIVGVAVCH